VDGAAPTKGDPIVVLSGERRVWPDASHRLGNGQHGRAFAARAIETGHQTTVWNRTPGRVAVLAASGAIEANTSKAAVAGADAVLVLLADDAAVLDVCLRDDGVLASLEPEAVFVNVSTVSPETARRLAELGPERRVLDAPVMGSPAMIAGGLGRFLIGGPATAISVIEPLWNDLGSGYTYCGPVGTGATMKILANSLLIYGGDSGEPRMSGAIPNRLAS
jgi:3-hydroxyisobutyrate dehydrogenase-like beta-hydroxyacid dehydrogenase